MRNIVIFSLICMFAPFLSANDDHLLKQILDAVKENQIETAKKLLEDKPDIINMHYTNGSTLLTMAIPFRDVETVKRLLELGANANKPTMVIGGLGGYSPLHWASLILLDSEIEIMRLLLAHSANPNLQEPTHGETPLHMIRGDQRIGLARLLLAHGADPNKKDNNGSTPLHKHAMYGAIETIKDLLANGANPNIKNESGLTPATLFMKETTKAVFEEFTKFNVRVDTYETRVRKFFSSTEYYKKKIAEGTVDEITINIFPDDIWRLIAQYLSFKDQSNLAMLNKQVRQTLMPRILNGLPIHIMINHLTESEKEKVPLYTWKDLDSLPKLPKIEEIEGR